MSSSSDHRNRPTVLLGAELLKESNDLEERLEREGLMAAVPVACSASKVPRQVVKMPPGLLTNCRGRGLILG